MLRPIIVFGASGQVGRELMLRHDPTERPLIGFTHQQLDITDAAQIAAAIASVGPGLAINAAAFTAVDKAESQRPAAFAVNCDGPANIASACAKAGLPLLHISTDYVFDGHKPIPYVETDRTAPLGVYGASKLAGEDAVRQRLDRHIIVRTAWVYAPHGANFVRTILRLAAERDELRVVDDQRGGPTPAGAIADALLAIAAQILSGKEAWGTYHFCGAPQTTWFGFAQAIVAAAAPKLKKLPRLQPITTAEYPTPAKRPGNSMLDGAKLASTFGVTPADWRVSLPDIVAALMPPPT